MYTLACKKDGIKVITARVCLSLLLARPRLISLLGDYFGVSWSAGSVIFKCGTLTDAKNTTASRSTTGCGRSSTSRSSGSGSCCGIGSWSCWAMSGSPKSLSEESTTSITSGSANGLRSGNSSNESSDEIMMGRSGSGTTSGWRRR